MTETLDTAPRDGNDADGAALNVRSAIDDDADAIAGLINRAYANPRGWVNDSGVVEGSRTNPDRIRSLLYTPGSAVLVADRGDEKVAACHISTTDGVTADAGMFAVAPEWQSRGLAQQLGAAVLEFAARELDCEYIEIEVLNAHDHLRRAYERAGFTTTGEVHPFPAHAARRDGLTFVVLRKRLSLPTSVHAPTAMR